MPDTEIEVRMIRRLIQRWHYRKARQYYHRARAEELYNLIDILTVKFKYLESEKIEILEWRDTSCTITTDNPLHLKVRFYSDYGPVIIEIRKKFYRNGSWLVPRDYETYGLKYIGADGKILGEIYASSDFDNCKTCNYYMTSSPEFEAAIDEIDNYTEQCLRSNAFTLPALEKS